MRTRIIKQFIRNNKTTTEDLRYTQGIIYLIINKVNYKLYVGKSLNSFTQRYRLKDWHKEISSIHLQRAIEKYGIENFTICIIKCGILDNIELSRLETSWILFFKSYKRENGYNITLGGDGVKLYRTEDFIEKSKKIFPNLFSYEKSIYISDRTKIIFKCNKHHHEFLQTPNNHFSGRRGCKFCDNENRIFKLRNTFDEFVGQANQIHGNKYNYFIETYKHTHHTTKIECKLCGNIFYQIVRVHTLLKCGCPNCGEKQRASLRKNPVKQINLSGELIKIHQSTADAMRELGIKGKNISTVLKGKRKSAGGFRWKYATKSEYENYTKI